MINYKNRRIGDGAQIPFGFDKPKVCFDSGFQLLFQFVTLNERTWLVSDHKSGFIKLFKIKL